MKHTPAEPAAAPAENYTPTAPKADTAEDFVGSAFKFSIATYITFGFTGLGILFTNIFVVDGSISGFIGHFILVTNFVMAAASLGLDQSLIRFFYEPPSGYTSHGVFRICFYISSLFVLLAGVVASLVFAGPFRVLLQQPGYAADYIVPLLFLNGFFWIVARYFNILLRMEQKILLYTIHTVLMTFFGRVFYFIGASYPDQYTGMLWFAVAGYGLFAAGFMLWGRRILRPRLQELRPKTLLPALRVLLAFGALSAITSSLVIFNNLIGYTVAGILVGKVPAGQFSFGLTLSGIVTAVQAGFATFWGAYMFGNYKTQQERIKKVHDFLNFIILVFFCALVAFQDIIFIILYNRQPVRFILPLMMLAAVFGILCEGTVYGIAIAKKPVYDTLGFVLAVGLNIGLCYLLIPRYLALGAAIALAVSSFAMFLLRTLVAQRFYRTIKNPLKTAAALAVAIIVAVAGTVWVDLFALRAAVCGGAILFYCVLYRAEFMRSLRLAGGILKALFRRGKK